MSSQKFLSGRFLKLLRRIHMYLGLLIFPWAILYGISGIYFNHAGLGKKPEVKRLKPQSLSSLTGFKPWPAKNLAQDLVQYISATSSATFTLDVNFQPHYEGWTMLESNNTNNRHVMLLDLNKGRAAVLTYSRVPNKARFPETKVNLDNYSMKDVTDKVSRLLVNLDIKNAEALKPHPQSTQTLRFRVIDETQQIWNLEFSPQTQKLTGRLSHSWPQVDAYALLSKLHTTHHYPAGFNSLFFWALLQDLLGLTLLFWSISGILMWWQMKPTRFWGTISVIFALIFSAAIMTATSSHILFGDVAPSMGPGSD